MIDKNIKIALVVSVFLVSSVFSVYIAWFYYQDNPEPKGSITAVVVPDDRNITALNSTNRSIQNDKLVRNAVSGAVENGTQWQKVGVSKTKLEKIRENLSVAPYHDFPHPGYYIRHKDKTVAVTMAINSSSSYS